MELADLGAVIELTAVSCKQVRDVPRKSPKEMASTIRQVRQDRCVLATDYGWTKALPRPAEGMREFLELLWGEGVTEGELKAMVNTNPARLPGLQV